VQVLRVSWKVATDKELRNEVKSGRITTSKDSDWTLKVDVTGLEPDSKYYYQVKTFAER
jgi:alkaline phosphatase D